MLDYLSLLENSVAFVPEDHFKVINPPGDLAVMLKHIEHEVKKVILPKMGIRDMTVFYTAPNELNAFGVYIGGTWEHPMIGIDPEKHRRGARDREELQMQLDGTLAHELAHAYQDKKKHIKGEDADEDGAEAFAARWVRDRIVDLNGL